MELAKKSRQIGPVVPKEINFKQTDNLILFLIKQINYDKMHVQKMFYVSHGNDYDGLSHKCLAVTPEGRT